KYLIATGNPDVGTTKFFTDYDSLGVDDNGVYFGYAIYPSDGDVFVEIAATPKAPLVAASPSLGPVTEFSPITDMWATPQPALNYDPVGPSEPAWFFASSTLVYAAITYRSLTWSGGTPRLSPTSSIPTAA